MVKARKPHNNWLTKEIITVTAITFGLLVGIYLVKHPGLFAPKAAGCPGVCYYQYCPTGYHNITGTCSNIYDACCGQNAVPTKVPTSAPKPTVKPTSKPPTPTPIPACQVVCYYQYCPTGYTYGQGKCANAYDVCCIQSAPVTKPPPTPLPTPGWKENCNYQTGGICKFKNDCSLYTAHNYIDCDKLGKVCCIALDTPVPILTPRPTSPIIW